MDAQVPCIKWHKSMHTVSVPYLWTSNHGSKIVQVFIQKILPIHGPAQLKPVLINDQLHDHPQICKTVFPRQDSMKYYLSRVLQLSLFGANSIVSSEFSLP